MPTTALMLAQNIAAGGGPGISITWNVLGSYNITSLGAIDWALWVSGSASPGTNKAPSQRKSGGGSLIGNLTCSTANLQGFTAYTPIVTWTDGAPTASSSAGNGEFNDLNSTGTSTNGANAQTTVPASTTTRKTRVFAGAYNSAVTLTCSLGDASAGPVTNTSLNDPGSTGTFGYYEITCTAGSSTTMTINMTAAANGAYSDVEFQGVAYGVP